MDGTPVRIERRLGRIQRRLHDQSAQRYFGLAVIFLLLAIFFI
jgi:hypothetical protein